MHPTFSKYLTTYSYYFLIGQNLKPYIYEFEQSQWFSYENLVEIQWKKLKRVLTYAHKKIPFYRKRFDRNQIHPEDIKSIDDMMKMPILTKDDIRNEFEGMIRHDRNMKIFKRKTSGSSGAPLELIKDGKNLAVMDAIMYRNYGWFNIDFGQKQARYWGIPLGVRGKLSIKLKDILLNRIRFSSFDISEKACLDFIEKLNEFRPGYLYGYSQTIFKFSEYVVKKEIDLSPLKLKVVILTGEMIYDEQIKTIEAAFKCPVSNEYGCTEAGIIAMECPNKGMHLMIENLFIEFLKDGKQALPGEEGEIIITELYGNLMPLIRYNVGDIGSPSDELCDCRRGLPLLNSLKGRNDEFIVCPNGKHIDPIAFDYILKEIPPKYGKVTQFRIVQESIHYLNIDLCYKGNQASVILGKIEEKFRKIIGEDFKIDFQLMDCIPVEESGKLRCFISKVKK